MIAPENNDRVLILSRLSQPFNNAPNGGICVTDAGGVVASDFIGERLILARILAIGRVSFKKLT